MASRPRTGELFATEPEPVPAGGYAAVALPRPVRCEFTYHVPEALEERVRPGVRVAVPFGSLRQVGVVVRRADTTDLAPGRVKSIAEVLDPEPIVDGALLELTRWMAEHYACSWGEALAAALPAALKREGGRRRVLVVAAREGVGEAELAELEERFPKQHRVLRTLLEVGAPVELNDLRRRLNLSDSPARSLARRGWVRILRVEAAPDELSGSSALRARPERLTEDQVRAVDAICGALDASEGGTFLLYGVTGSGKTEVYLRAIEHALERGRGAIVLVPEIALTPQTVGWFRSRFGEVAVLHSRLTDVQRLEMWMRLRRGDARVVVGARSAVFAPVANLGVVVVDEEHEPSFKQGNAPRYHARDVAIERARLEGAVCVLGSATPALETWRAASQRTYGLLELPTRVGGARLPRVEVVDTRQELEEDRRPQLFSRRLRGLLGETLERREQAILFINRRGFAPVLWCRACGETVRCRQCDLSMTFHRRIGRLLCHSCCTEIVPPQACPSCTAPGLRLLGVGSERVEAELRALFPKARVKRMDSDTMVRREDYEATLDAFGQGAIDVLVGTQMIAKGLDFPRVTLVGIVSADAALHLPDFRAAERTFQLLAQVAGRAGRGEVEGRIVVQTVTPEHAAVTCAARHDYKGFVAVEEPLRAELGYPPFGRLIRVVFDDVDESRVTAAADACAELLRATLDPNTIQVLGPAAAPLALLRGRHRHHLMLKTRAADAAFGAARELLADFAAQTTRPRVSIDVDPVGML